MQSTVGVAWHVVVGSPLAAAATFQDSRLLHVSRGGCIVTFVSLVLSAMFPRRRRFLPSGPKRARQADLTA